MNKKVKIYPLKYWELDPDDNENVMVNGLMFPMGIDDLSLERSEMAKWFGKIVDVELKSPGKEHQWWKIKDDPNEWQWSSEAFQKEFFPKTHPEYFL